MNTDEPREPSSSEGSADDHVEVLVEDLFLEEYEAPLTLAAERSPSARGRLARALGSGNGARAFALVGIIALGVVAVALVVESRKRTSMVSRLFGAW